VLGLDFGGSKTAAAVVDLAGARLGDVLLTAAPGATAEHTFAAGITAARTLLADVADGRQLAAVGACTFGIPHADRVELAPTIPGWEALPFGAALERAFPTAAVRVETDVKAAARAELDGGALAGCETGLYVNVGTGLAAALIVHGAVVTGHNGAAGEIGYNIDTAGRGVLEERAGGKALEAAAVRLLGHPDVAGLFARADADPDAAAVRDAFVAELCFHVVNLTIALDPQRVVFGGGLVRSWGHFGPALERAVRASVPFPPELVRAAHPYDAPLLGALALGRAALSDLSTVADVLSEGAPA
jgi:glucokinase